jgi:hypothetical protein
MENNKLFSKIVDIRVELLGKLDKGGKNTYSKYDYFQLSDFMPYILKACQDKKIYTKFWIGYEKFDLPKTIVETTIEVAGLNAPQNTITENFQYKEFAYLKLVDLETGEEELYKKETANVNVSGAQPIQNAGGKTTYMRRYMYMDAFEITENDFVEENTGKPEKAETKTATKKTTVKTVETPKVEETTTDIAAVNDLPFEEPKADTVPSGLMTMDTKVKIATYMKEKGLNPQTEILKCAQELGVDVPQLREEHYEKIIDIVNNSHIK